MERLLAAILYADVAGYSRLTGLDEEKTHRELDAGLNLLTDGSKHMAAGNFMKPGMPFWQNSKVSPQPLLLLSSSNVRCLSKMRLLRKRSS